MLLDEANLKMSVRVSEGDHRARMTAKIDQKANMHAYMLPTTAHAMKHSPD